MKNHSFSPANNYSLSVDDYQKNIKCLEKDLLYFTRVDKYPKTSVKIDTFAGHWLLGFSPEPEINISIRNGENYISIQKSKAIFIPKYCLVEWNIQNSIPFRWDAFISPTEVPSNFIRKPIVFPYDSNNRPQTISQIFTLIGSHLKASDYIEIEQQKVISTLALRVKEIIDDNFREDISITELTKKLNVSRMSFSSSFKKAYGLTPVAYRHRLRIFEGLRLINQGHSVTDAVLASGFSDHAQFINHFKKTLGTTPVHYSPNQLLINPDKS